MTKPISFDISPEYQKALDTLAGGRKVRLLGTVSGNKLHVNFITCNAAFMACNAAFNACNAAFSSGAKK